MIRYELAEEVSAGWVSQAEWELLPQWRTRVRLYAAAARRPRAAAPARPARRAGVRKWQARRIPGRADAVARARVHVRALRTYLDALALAG